jgi:signal transduction histidine kinase
LRQPGRVGENVLWQRIISALVGIPLILIAVWYGGAALLILIGIITILGIREMMQILARLGLKPVSWLGVIGGLILLGGTYLHTEGYPVSAITIILFLQGRFPIRVELESLTRADFQQILTEPRNAIIKQYTELLATEGVKVKFFKDSLEEIADIAYTVNEQTENIGARRLFTIMEKLLEDISFDAPDLAGQEIDLTPEYIHNKLGELVKNQDFSRYIL